MTRALLALLTVLTLSCRRDPPEPCPDACTSERGGVVGVLQWSERCRRGAR